MFLAQINLQSPLFKARLDLKLKDPITIIVGENGAGKSTILERVAYEANLPTIGSLKPNLNLVADIKLSWQKRAHAGFFFRTESQIEFESGLAQQNQELNSMVSEFDSFTGYGKQLAQGTIRGQLGALSSRYGQFEVNSHGQAFLKLMHSRITMPGLYLIDEPEAALSFQSQLQLVNLIYQKIGEGSQFLIATHSPVIAAMAHSSLFEVTSTGAKLSKYSQIEAFTNLRDFLNSPQVFLRHLDSRC